MAKRLTPEEIEKRADDMRVQAAEARKRRAIKNALTDALQHWKDGDDDDAYNRTRDAIHIFEGTIDVNDERSAK